MTSADRQLGRGGTAGARLEDRPTEASSLKLSRTEASTALLAHPDLSQKRRLAGMAQPPEATFAGDLTDFGRFQ